MLLRGELIAAILLVAIILWAIAGPLRNSCGRSHRLYRRRSWDSSRGLAVDLSLSAIARDVARFSASVARLSCSIQRTAIGSSAIARDVS